VENKNNTSTAIATSHYDEINPYEEISSVTDAYETVDQNRSEDTNPYDQLKNF